MKLALPLIACLPFAAAISAAQSVVVGRPEIIQQLQQGNDAAALALAKDALNAHPGDCALLSLQAIALGRLHQEQPALQSFESALTHCPAYLPALEGAAQIEFAQGSPDAVPLLERILKLNPGDPTAHGMLASSLHAQGKCAEALPHYEASRALFPDRPDLVERYGSCLVEGGDYKAALVLYLQLLASHHNDTVRYNVALLQWKAHANDDALATLAPLLNEKQAPSLALASRIHEEKGETPQAVALLREAILQSPREVDNYLDFAALAFAHNSFQVGIDMLDTGLTQLPQVATLYVARGVLEVQLSKTDAAIADFEQAHRIDPKLSFAVDAVGMMQSQQHQDKESLALFEAQAKQHPDDPLLQYLLAEQLSQAASEDDAAKLSAAIAAAKRSTILDPGYHAAHDLLAVLYVRAKQPKLAIQEAEIALAKDPNDEVALYQEIMARRRSGDTEGLGELVSRFQAARKENSQRQQSSDRYRLQEEAQP